MATLPVLNIARAQSSGGWRWFRVTLGAVSDIGYQSIGTLLDVILERVRDMVTMA